MYFIAIVRCDLKPVLYELIGLENRHYSQFSWRTRLALLHEELPAGYRSVRVSDKESIAFSAQTKVPILVDGDTMVTDSWKIAEYLETNYPTRPSLFGGDVGHGLSRFINGWGDRRIIPAAAPLVDGFARSEPTWVAPSNRKISLVLKGLGDPTIGNRSTSMRGSSLRRPQGEA